MHKLSAMYDDGLCIFACGQIATLSADERHPHLSTYAFSTPEARIPALMRGTGQISFRSIIGKTKHHRQQFIILVVPTLQHRGIKRAYLSGLALDALCAKMTVGWLLRAADEGTVRPNP